MLTTPASRARADVSDALIEVAGLTKRFPSSSQLARVLRRDATRETHEVLRGVDLRVDQGDFVALLGGNGAGKTTILKTIATLLRPDGGSVHVMGRDVVQEERRVRADVGFVLADERSFHWRLSATQNLDFFARLDGIPARLRSSRIDYLLGRLDLKEAANRPFGQFSTGMKQRLAVARALLKRPTVLLMDEPTRSIDSSHASDVWRLVCEEVEEVSGCLVLVTHQIQEALTLCNRVAILADGQIVLDTSADTLARFATEVDGFTVSVRGLSQRDIDRLGLFPGIRGVRVASQVADEKLLEVQTSKGTAVMPGFLGELTGMGATICSLQRSTPLQGVVERLLLESRGLSA